MKRILLILLFAALFAKDASHSRWNNLALENIPDIPNSVRVRLRPYQNVRYTRFLDWLPEDLGLLIRTRFSETNQVHLIETPGSMRCQLTFYNEPIDECTVCPDARKTVFLFTKDSAGNEVGQIYMFDYATGESRLLTDNETKHNSVVWSRKGDKFAFRSNKRKKRDYDIYLGDLHGRESFQLVLKRGGYWYPVTFSPDDSKLLVKKYVSSNESYYFILDHKSRELVDVDHDSAAISYGTARWSPDMSGIYIVADKFSDFKQLLYYDLERGEFKVLTKQIPWDIGEVELSPSGNTLAFTSNEDAYSRLYLMDTKSHALNRINLPDGLISSIQFKPDRDELAFSMTTPRSPTDVYSLNLRSRTLLRWTSSEAGGLDTAAFVAPRLIHYETFDSIDGQPRQIPAFYYEPIKRKPPFPVLIDCHGGPAVQRRPYFSSLTQFYLNELGVAVIAPNVRGSSGYGKRFMMLDDGYKREDAIKDIGALLDWIEMQPQLDAGRVAIKGASYGGYMVLASMVYYNDRLRCGIDELGISNFVTFLENTGKYRQDVRRTEYGDERDPSMRDFLSRISPLTNAHRIEKPMLILQGLHDPRVPVSEAEQIVKAIRNNDVDVWYILAEDEGHGLSKKSNRNFYQQAQVLFLEKYLLLKR